MLLALLLACWYAVVLLVLTWFHDEPVAWTEPLPGALGGFGGAGIGLWLQRRRVGGAQRLREYTRALKSGRLPPHADPSEWRTLLAGEDRARRRAAVLSYAVVGLTAVLLTGVAAVRFSGGLLEFAAATVTALVVLLALLAWASRRQRRRIERLVAQLPEEPIPAR
jgi:Flp pilus assembly protein TadB